MCLEHATAAVSPPHRLSSSAPGHQGCKTLCAIKPGLVNDINIVLTLSLLGIMHWWYSTVQDYTISRYGGIIIICIIAKSPNLSLGKSK